MLGALGSGLWELIKPLFIWASSASLGIVTLGLDSLRDGLYSDAASHEVERVSASVLAGLTGIVTGVVFAFMVFPRRKLLGEVTAPKTEELDEMRAYRDALNEKIAALKRLKFIVGTSLAAVLTLQVLMTQRTIYVSKAFAHVNRLCIIAEPYTDEKTLRQIRSSFAQTSSRVQYVAVVEKLEKIIESNGAYVPKFSIY